MSVRITIITAFPELVKDYLACSVLGRGIAAGKLAVETIDIRDFASGDYRQIDDYSYGGGGMVLMVSPLERALASVAGRDERYVVYPSPQGVPVHQALVEDLRRIASEKRLVIVCGHYEGVDERFVERNVDEEVSLGDFVLTGGELAALALTDAISRLVPGVVGRGSAVEDDSFFSGMLDHPHYTRPASHDGANVPDVLLGGDHAEIIGYRRRQSVERTLARRPDIVAGANIMPYLQKGVYLLQVHYPVLDREGNKSSTAITGLDLHDIARACRTYGVKKYVIATPLRAQRELIRRITAHWTSGYGAEFNPDRKEAFAGIKSVASIEEALGWIEKRERAKPYTVATTARPNERAVNLMTLKRELLTLDRPVVFLFGTGWGLHDEVTDSASAVLMPIMGGGGYNHLSVRSAASIVLDRFFGFR